MDEASSPVIEVTCDNCCSSYTHPIIADDIGSMVKTTCHDCGWHNWTSIEESKDG